MCIRDSFYSEIADLDESGKAPKSYSPVSNEQKIYSIQIGVAKTEALAEKYLKRMTKLGLKDGYYSPKIIKGKKRYLLRYGVFEDNDKAKKRAKTLTKKHRLKSKVILLD